MKSMARFNLRETGVPTQRFWPNRKHKTAHTIIPSFIIYKMAWRKQREFCCSASYYMFQPISKYSIQLYNHYFNIFMSKAHHPKQYITHQYFHSCPPRRFQSARTTNGKYPRYGRALRHRRMAWRAFARYRRRLPASLLRRSSSACH